LPPETCRYDERPLAPATTTSGTHCSLAGDRTLALSSGGRNATMKPIEDGNRQRIGIH
jgi:hypothetical protein